MKPKPNGFYMGICHPFQGHDFLNEGSTNGAADIMKRYDAGIDQLKNGIDPAKQQLAVMDGVIWIQTTTVGKPVISANQNYNAYVTGNEAISRCQPWQLQGAGRWPQLQGRNQDEFAGQQERSCRFDRFLLFLQLQVGSWTASWHNHGAIPYPVRGLERLIEPLNSPAFWAGERFLRYQI